MYSQKRFPVWGFGAKFEGIVRHAFQVGIKAEVNGISGILEAYRGVFQSGLTMSSPIVYSQVIEVAAKKATQSLQKAMTSGRQSYGVLLILTHGCVSDMHRTKEALKKVSKAPLSVVIVGIGVNDFSSMHILEAGEDVLRNICNFVEFAKYKNEHVSIGTESMYDYWRLGWVLISHL